MSLPLVLGLDIGGTSTRALVADTLGHRHGRGRGPGANLTSHAVDQALAAISTAIRAALAQVGNPDRVQRAVVGTAGAGNLEVAAIRDAFDRMWRQTGLSCRYEVVSDARAAFVAGTPEPDGTLLLCGTGALAARFEDRRRVHTADGHGWLLGDLGSGFWLGREAVRATLGGLDRLGSPGPLAQAVLRAVLADGDEPDLMDSPEAMSPARLRRLASDLVLRVHSQSPIALAEFAPLVSAHAHDDAVAAQLLNEAAGHLLATVSTVRGDDDGTPLVLAGALLTSDTPLRRLVEPRLAERWPEARVAVATDGAAGAAWLAATTLIGIDTPQSAVLHATLLSRN